jgi:hypothetical protein
MPDHEKNLGTSLEGLISLNKNEVKDDLDDIILSNTPLYRLKKDGSKVIVPVDKLDTYLGEHGPDITFYLEEDWRKHIPRTRKVENIEKESGLEEIPEADRQYHDTGRKETGSETAREDTAYSGKLREISKMSLEERKQNILKNVMVMENLSSRHARFNTETLTETVEVFTETLCINKTSLEENIEKPLEESFIKDIVTKTHMMVNSLINMLEKGKTSFMEMARLDHIQTGSNTLNHMNRMLIRFISFLFYYNKYFQTDKIKRVRSNFEKKYHSYYNKVVRGEQKVNLEIVFKGGIHPIQSKSLFLEFCVGALIHDLGKVPKIMYHDSGEGYDYKSARMHVFDSYNMILKSKSFTLAEATMGLLHHEYYGAPYGYNQTETLREKMQHRVKKQKVEMATKFFITYDLDDLLNGSAFAFFPNKLMELLDVYDSLTDREKKYRPKENTPREAVSIIRTEFIEGAHLGIDPVLYDIFIDFLQESGIIMDYEEIEHLKL